MSGTVPKRCISLSRLDKDLNNISSREVKQVQSQTTLLYKSNFKIFAVPTMSKRGAFIMTRIGAAHHNGPVIQIQRGRSISLGPNSA
jgi:hypothetical protein